MNVQLVKQAAIPYLLRALFGKPDVELNNAQMNADANAAVMQAQYNKHRRDKGLIPIDYKREQAIRDGRRQNALLGRRINYNDPFSVLHASLDEKNYLRTSGMDAYDASESYKNKELVPRDKAIMGAPVMPKPPKSRNLPERPQQKMAKEHTMHIQTVQQSMLKHAAYNAFNFGPIFASDPVFGPAARSTSQPSVSSGAQIKTSTAPRIKPVRVPTTNTRGGFTPAFMRNGQTSQYATYDPGHFSPQDQSRISTMAGRMGIHGPVSSIRMQNGQVAGLNGMGYSQQPVAVQYRGRPQYGMQGILSAQTPVQQLIGAIRTTRGVGPDFNPMTPRGLAPSPKPDTQGLSDYSRAMLLANWRAQNEPLRQRRLQYWSGLHDNLAAAEARRRQQIIANNNALRGKPMRGFYKDNATGNFVAINGTAGGQNFSKREDMALQGYALPKRNLANVTTTDWSNVKPTHYKMTPNLQRPNDPKYLRKQLRATA